MSSVGPDGLTATNTDLLIGLKDAGNDRIWTAFCSRYRPVLVSFGRRLGLQESDAQDAAQETLLAFAHAYRRGDYARDRGRLRTWLFGIASHKVRDLQRRLCRRSAAVPAAAGPQPLASELDERGMSAIWETQWRRAIVDACLDEVYGHVEPSTVAAFELFVLEDWAVDKVAAHLGMTRNAVFKAQRRVLSRMREFYTHLDANW